MDGSIINNWIEENNFTRKQAAEFLGISVATLKKLESNPGKMPLHIYGLITRSKINPSLK